MAEKLKQLYCGWFETGKRVYIERVYAYSERQAWALICKRIAKKQGVSSSIVFNWFQDKDKYKIQIEVLFKEVD